MIRSQLLIEMMRSVVVLILVLQLGVAFKSFFPLKLKSLTRQNDVLHNVNGMCDNTLENTRLEKCHLLPPSAFTIIPEDLARVGTLPVKLRSYEQCLASDGKIPNKYDLHEHDGLVLPSPGLTFKGANGMSLRPLLHQKPLVETFSGVKFKVFVLSAGLKLPDNLILLHEYGNHYSIQVRVPMTLLELNGELTSLLEKVKSLSKEEYLQMLIDTEDEECFSN